MRGCLWRHTDISASLPPPCLSILWSPSVFGSKRQAQRRMSSPQGVTDSLSDLFPVCRLFFLGSLTRKAAQKRDTAKSTEDKRIHSTHSSGTSSFAHRKYQHTVFVWTDNKYYLNLILISFLKCNKFTGHEFCWVGVKLNKTVTEMESGKHRELKKRGWLQ